MGVNTKYIKLGFVTPQCSDCGVKLCWDVSIEEYKKYKDFWNQWTCSVCNPEYKGAYKRFKENIMGVKQCSRKDCEEIMCDTYVPDVGYVCGSCKKEFYEIMENEEKEILTELGFIVELGKFMEKPKGISGEEIHVTDFFEKHTD